MLLTADQLAEIARIIEDHHAAFVANTISPEAVQADVLERLKAQGLLDVKVDSLTQAYVYGQVVAQLGAAAAEKMSYRQFLAHVRKNPVPLTTAERNSVALAQTQAGQYCRGLGNRVSAATGAILIEADQALRSRLEGTIRDRTAEALALRQTTGRLKSELGWETGDWARDLDRIAATELQNASELGLAQEYRDEYGPDVLVSKVPAPDACARCKDLFLDKETGQPKVFRLSDLEANGTNVGRKQADWKAVTGTIHPHCFPAGTAVFTDCGEKEIEKIRPGDLVLTHCGRWRPVTAVWETLHEKELVRLKLIDGRTLELTDNHPVMVRGGRWLEAHLLQSGDEVLGLNIERLVPLRQSDANGAPPENIEDLLLLFVLRGLSGAGMPVTAVYFDGKFSFREADVDIDDIKRAVWHDHFGGKRCGQSVENTAFVCGIEPSLVKQSALAKKGFRAFAASNSVMSSLRDRLPLFWGCAGVENKTSGACSALGQPTLTDASDDAAAGHAESGGYRFDRLQLVEVSVNDSVSIKFDSSCHGCHPFEYSVIADVTSSPSPPQVYNLSVAGDESYIANGVVVHNCGCSLVRVPPGWGWEDGELKPGVKGKVHDEGELKKALEEEAEHGRAHVPPPVGRRVFQGLPIVVETAAGRRRHWVDAQGRAGSTLMLYDYGYVEGTHGVDEDGVDVFVGPDEQAENAYVCHQQDPTTGLYDEEKVFLGFASEEQAARAYLAHYDDPTFLVAVSVMGVDQLRRWLAATFRRPEEMAAGAEELRLVVPVTLKKTQVPAELGAADSAEGNRAPGHGTVPNLLFNVPSIKPPRVAQGMSMVLRDPRLKRDRDHLREAMTRDPRIWDFDNPAARRLIGFDPGDHAADLVPETQRADAEEQKRRLEKRGRQNVGDRNKPAARVESENG